MKVYAIEEYRTDKPGSCSIRREYDDIIGAGKYHDAFLDKQKAKNQAQNYKVV